MRNTFEFSEEKRLFDKLRKNHEYQEVYKKGKSLANRYLVMYVLEREDGPNRYGISVSKKVGNSVVRHRITRLIRESIRKDDERTLDGKDIIIIARVSANNKSFVEIDGAVMHLFKIHGLLK